MSGPDAPAQPAGRRAGPDAEPAKPDAGTPPDAKGTEPPAADAPRGADDTAEEHDQPQTAWTARRDLIGHSPRTMDVGGHTRFGGGLAGHDQHGVRGGRVTGDVIMGSKTEIHYAIPGLSFSASAAASGEIPAATLERLAATFVADEEFVAQLLERLRRDRGLVLSGARFTGRRTAAPALLSRLGAAPVRTLVRDTAPESLAAAVTAGRKRGDEGNGAADPLGGGPPHGDPATPPGQVHGYVLCDLHTRRDRPLREPHVLAAKERLAAQGAFLVVTVGPGAVLEDVPCVEWRPPAAADVLGAHLGTRTDAVSARKVLELPDVVEFLTRDHQLREVAAFAGLLGRYAAGEADEDAVAQFSLAALENQVREWFEEDESALPLRDKAFLVALAAFDGGPYALTAELSDLLYRYLQETDDPGRPAAVPVFGTHVGKRLRLARARKYEENEHTEGGR